MDALFTTRCPRCETRFNITAQHMQQASGAVRCGECMNVFQADQHQVNDVSTAQPQPTVPSAPQQHHKTDSKKITKSNSERWNEALEEARIALEDIHLDPEPAPQAPAENSQVNNTPAEDSGIEVISDPVTDDPFAGLVVDKAPTRRRVTASRPPRRRILGASIALVLMLSLVAQVIYMNKDRLATHPQWRPMLVAVCQLTGCELASAINLANIEGSHLIVRQHPDNPDALMVDAMLLNSAAHSQPFPKLELRFSDQHNVLVAAGRFQPKDYLQGELSALSAMPPNTPLHISLAITNPGDDASHYTLRLLAPDM